MPKHTHTTRYAAYVRAAFVVCLALAAGCQTGPRRTDNELAVRGAIEHYRAERADQLVQTTAAATCNLPDSKDRFEHTILTLGTFARDDPPATQAATTQSTPATAAAKPAPPEGYWRQDLWHQMGHEALELGSHDFWHGYKTTFWNLPNVLALTGTMGASLAIQGTGVDATVRERTKGHSTLGHMSEPLQILGHPATHFAATGVLWLGSTLTQDMREHEVAKALTQALAVNGVTTLMLKAAANTRSPDNEHFGWPSGHTSSAFTAAAVLTTLSAGSWDNLPIRVLKTGSGHGRKEFDALPNIVRAFLVEVDSAPAPGTDTVTVMECDIDDQSGEVMGTPNAPAFSQSTSIRYSGTSSRPLCRTFANRGSFFAKSSN